MTTHQSTMSSALFATLLADQMERQQCDEGVRALIKQYYLDMSDATELDPKWLAALRIVTDHDGYLVDLLDDIIRETEAELSTRFRKIKTPLDSDNDWDET